MNTQTYNQKAFESVTYALENIENYNKSKQIKYLEYAEKSLKDAASEDSDYLDAIYYMGITLDLIGKPADASPLFNRILNELNNDVKLKSEVQYNLGVAYYHRYGHSFLKIAEENFLEVLKRKVDNSLKYLVLASLAQTYAMWMRPNEEQENLLRNNKSKGIVFDHIKSYFKKFEECEKVVFKGLGYRKIRNKIVKNKIEAMVYNAKGMALMYYTDFIKESKDIIRSKLEESLNNLRKSDEKYPEDWANTCDLGSNYWRLAIISRSDIEKKKYFEKAIELFNKVINKLRPNYGFALYELGNIYRTMGDFNKAILYYDQSLSVSEKYRDISTDKVNKEKQRAFVNNKFFP